MIRIRILSPGQVLRFLRNFGVPAIVTYFIMATRLRYRWPSNVTAILRTLLRHLELAF